MPTRRSPQDTAAGAEPRHRPSFGMSDESTAAEHRQFLVLFYWDGEAPDLARDEWQRREDAFHRWARAVETRGEITVAERVDPRLPTVWLAGPQGAELPAEDRPPVSASLDRFCVIRARDRAAALDLARHAPHLRHGGLVAVVSPHREGPA